MCYYLTKHLNMKKLFNKTNELWLSFRKWSDVNVFGYLIGSIVKIILIVIVFTILFYSLFIIGPFKDNSSLDSSISDSSDTTNDNCSIMGIELHGTLLTYIPNHSENDSLFDYNTVASQNIIWAIKQANEDEKIKAIVIEVDSGGGSPTGGEEVANAIKGSEKPVVAFIREVGASSAYWAISSADKIFASKNSNVGAIGITASYVSVAEKNKKDGYIFEEINSGKFKDSGSPDKPLTNEERLLMLRDVNIVFGNFVEAISKNRNIPIEKVRSIADGSTVLGSKAKELGLIDAIGGISEVEQYLEETTGGESDICWQ